MKEKIIKISKYFFSIILTAFFLTIGIDAADHYDNFSQSIMGRVVLGKEKAPCPPDLAFVSTENGGFCIDKFENSPGDKCPNEITASQVDTLYNLNVGNCKPVSEINKIPWTNISQTQAAVACAKAGKRLPSDEEWYYASLGTPDKKNGWTESDCQVKKNWPNQPGETGSGENCVSGIGAYDMVGNIWEWVKAETKDGKINGQNLPKQGYIKAVDINGLPIESDENKPDENFNNDYFWLKKTDIRGMARGGYWDNGADAGQFSVYLVSPPSFSGEGLGFRCAK